MNAPIIIGALALAASMFGKKKNDSSQVSVEESSGSGSTPNASTPSSSSSSSGTTNSFPIRTGTKGEHVKLLQRHLNNYEFGLPKLVVDGVFGSKTLEYVVKLKRGVTSIDEQLYSWLLSQNPAIVNTSPTQGENFANILFRD